MLRSILILVSTALAAAAIRLRNLRNRTLRGSLPAVSHLGCCLAMVMGLVGSADLVRAQAGYESYFMYLWCDPHEEKPGFLDGNEQLQGLAHDGEEWIVSAGESMHCGADPTWGIWKLPVTSGLMGTPTCRKMLSELPDGVRSHFFHVGDIDSFRGIVLAPVESYDCPEPKHAAILFFDAQDLHYIGKAALDNYRDFGWVAVNPADSLIYVSTDSTTTLTTYALKEGWADLLAKRRQTDLEVELTWTADISLKTGQGAEFPDVFHNTQGGVFSEAGSMFYLLVGAGCGPNQCDFCSDYYTTDGIHAFDTKTWREVRSSVLCEEDSAPCDSSCMDFRFHWSPEWIYFAGWRCSGEEPEGIDVWDLDRDQPGRGPYRGQLHVGWLDNNLGQDPVTVWHYTHSLYADAAAEAGGDGRPGDGHGRPFKTLQEAYDRACDGARLKLQPGSYDEAPTLSKRVTIEPREQGNVVIGTPGP